MEETRGQCLQMFPVSTGNYLGISFKADSEVLGRTDICISEKILGVQDAQAAFAALLE